MVQQGMNEESRTARRYHWLSERVASFVNEPHAAVCCDQRGTILNLVADDSGAARNASAELARESPERTLQVLEQAPTLVMPDRHALAAEDIAAPKRLAEVQPPRG